jgi:hypothetical protein
MRTPRRTWLKAAAWAGAAALLAAPAVQANPTPAATASPPPEVSATLPQARLQGSGRLRFLAFNVYDARLWTPAALTPEQWAAAPLALELQYLRKLDGPAIAERSLQEMKRQGEIAADTASRWLAEMRRVFPNVAAGDRITGVHLPGEGARFFFNGQLKGEVRDPEFSRWFFGIWLAPQTSEPAMRQQLLGATR